MGLVKPEVSPAFGTCVFKILKGTRKKLTAQIQFVGMCYWLQHHIISSFRVLFQVMFTASLSHGLKFRHWQIDSYIEIGCPLNKINLQTYSSINGLPEKGEWESREGPALSCARERRPYAAAQHKSTPAPAPSCRACPVAGAPAALCRTAERASAPADVGLRKPPGREPRTCRRRARCADSTWRTGGSAEHRRTGMERVLGAFGGRDCWNWMLEVVPFFLIHYTWFF